MPAGKTQGSATWGGMSLSIYPYVMGSHSRLELGEPCRENYGLKSSRRRQSYLEGLGSWQASRELFLAEEYQKCGTG